VYVLDEDGKLLGMIDQRQARGQGQGRLGHSQVPARGP
jgi:hypothetical protein